MNTYTKQIIDLAREGHSAEVIATMLNEDIENINIILGAIKIAEAQKIVSMPIVTNSAGEKSVDTTEYDSAQRIYKEQQKKIAERLTQIALYEVDNISAATKALIYCNEEATGRNEARAKKQNNVMLFQVGEALLQMNKARNAVASALQDTTKDTKLVAIEV